MHNYRYFIFFDPDIKAPIGSMEVHLSGWHIDNTFNRSYFATWIQKVTYVIEVDLKHKSLPIWQKHPDLNVMDTVVSESEFVLISLQAKSF